MELFNLPYFTLFLIVIIGFLIGNIKIKNVSLDISAILFVALVFGYFGIKLPEYLKYFGLVLFIFTIGFQAGPSFFETFRKEGKKLTILTLVIIFSGIIVTLACATLFHFSKDITAGIFAGALTSTPGFAAITELSSNIQDATLAYGISYPFGVIGVVLFIKLCPKIFKMNIDEAEKNYSSDFEEKHPKIINRNFIVENPEVIGKTLSEICIREKTGANISRILYKGNAFTPSPSTTLYGGAIIKAVGTENSLVKVQQLIGNPTDFEIVLNQNYDVRFIIITNKKVIGKTIEDLHIQSKYNIIVTRIRRSGVDFSATSNIKLHFGDKIKVAGTKDDIKKLTEFLGDETNKLYDNNYLPLALGIVLGILIGKISIKINEFNFSLGITGGVMLTGILLARIRKIGPLIFSMTTASNQIIRKIGLILFLSTVGTEAGGEIISAIKTNAWQIFVSGIFVTILPMVIAVIVSKYFLKIDILQLLGAITGGMTSTPGLAAASSMTKTNAPALAYATIYPIALVLMILGAQIIFWV